MRNVWIAAACVSLISTTSFGQSLQESLNDIDVGERWQYNDWDAAQAAAKRSGKPVLALFR